MTKSRRYVVGAVIAFSTASIAGLVAPAEGLVMHWSPDQAHPWRLPAVMYAAIALLVVPAVGWLINSTLRAEEDEQRCPCHAECATGIAYIAFAGFQRVGGVSMLLVLAVSLLLGLACYSVTRRWLS